MKKILKLITKEKIFGKLKCHMLNIEWQKRGWVAKLPYFVLVEKKNNT